MGSGTWRGSLAAQPLTARSQGTHAEILGTVVEVRVIRVSGGMLPEQGRKASLTMPWDA